MGEAAVTSKADQDGCLVGLTRNGWVGSFKMTLPSDSCSLTMTGINRVNTGVVDGAIGGAPTKHTKEWPLLGSTMLHIGMYVGIGLLGQPPNGGSQPDAFAAFSTGTSRS